MRRPKVRTAISHILYRLRPDRPEVGSELVQVKSNAKKSSFYSGQRIKVVSWNTYKGKRSGYREQLEREVEGTDLVLLQEFREVQAFDSFHQTVFGDKDAAMAVSYFTLERRLSPTGVYTASSVPAIQEIAVASPTLEPVVRTPKMAMCSWYPLNGSSDTLFSLLVVNCHGINFRFRRSFNAQIMQLREQFLQHKGPVLFVGDFNTWETGREKILDDMSKEFELTRIVFPKGIKHLGGHQLDRVYTRGGKVEQANVLVNRRASDHALLKMEFIVD